MNRVRTIAGTFLDFTDNGDGSVTIDETNPAGKNVENGTFGGAIGVDLSVYGLKADPLSQFAATTSAQLRGVISDETGTGALVFATSPTFTTSITSPLLQSLASLAMTSANGTDAIPENPAAQDGGDAGTISITGGQGGDEANGGTSGDGGTIAIQAGLAGANPDGSAGANGIVVINESGADTDFRIEGDGNAHLFFCDAGNDRVGMGTSAPETVLHVVGQVTSSGGVAGLIFKARDGGDGWQWYCPTNSRATLFSHGAFADIFTIYADTLRLHNSKTPASAGASGEVGQIGWDANYLYVCTATNTWKRVAIATW